MHRFYPILVIHMKKRTQLTHLLALVLALSFWLPCAWATDIMETDSAIEEADVSQVPISSGIYGLSADTPLMPDSALDLDGESLLLYEMNTGTLVYGKNIDEIREPASLTKLMTCLLAMEYGNIYDYITVTDSALSGLDPSGSAAGLKAGETYSLEELLYCLMVKSANDAAAVIAKYISGSQSDFVDLMNQRAQELGCDSTHFLNPHGLHEEGHVSSARDIAKILSACLDYDLFASLYSTASYTLPATQLQEERTLTSTNYLISSAITNEYLDSRVIGGKTGFTTPAGRCVACVADDGSGYRYLAVVLGAAGTDSDGKTIYGSFRSASALFNFGFENFSEQEALSAETYLEPMEVTDGDTLLESYTIEGVTCLLPVDFDSADLRLEPVLSEDLTVPIASGDSLGEAKVYYGDALLGRVPIVAANDVAYVEPRSSLPPARVVPHGGHSVTYLPKSFPIAMAV